MRLMRMRQVLRDRLKEIDDGLAARARGEIVNTHVPTGLKSIDDEFGGVERGVNTLVVGHTGDGKTAFLSRLIEGAARAGMGALGFFLEDPARREADRVLARPTGLDTRDLAQLHLAAGARERLGVAEAEADWADRAWVYFGMPTPEEVLDIADRACGDGLGETVFDKVPVGLIVVDYAQGFADDEQGMEAIVGHMAHHLNQLAGKYDLASILGSQAKNEVIKRGRLQWERTGGVEVDGFRPGKGDAKWSSRAQEYSKADWSIFRPGRWRLHLGDTGARDDTLELNVNKQNYGPEGQVLLGWHGPTTSILDRPKKAKR